MRWMAFTFILSSAAFAQGIGSLNRERYGPQAPDGRTSQPTPKGSSDRQGATDPPTEPPPQSPPTPPNNTDTSAGSPRPWYRPSR